MKISMSTPAIALTMVLIAGCEGGASGGAPTAVVLQPENGAAVTLNVPRGYIEEPKDLKGPIPNVVLRMPSDKFEAANVFAAESEVRIAMEPSATDADAAHERHAAALRKHKSSVEALAKSKEQSKSGLIAYTYPNGEEPDAQAYFLTSKSGDVFVECRRSVCKAYKTWNKRLHMRFDFRPVDTANVAGVDGAIDRMLQSFAPERSESK